jgi:hypothetical protein
VDGLRSRIGDEHGDLVATSGFGLGQQLDVILDPTHDGIVVFVDM